MLHRNPISFAVLFFLLPFRKLHFHRKRQFWNKLVHTSVFNTSIQPQSSSFSVNFFTPKIPPTESDKITEHFSSWNFLTAKIKKAHLPRFEREN